MTLADVAGASAGTAALLLVVAGALWVAVDHGQHHAVEKVLWRLIFVALSVAFVFGVVAIWLGAASGWGEG